MKSERRHELQQNELADWMAVVVEKTKPYANVILGGLVVLAILAVVWGWMARQSGEEQARAWEDFYSAVSSQSFAELNNIVEHYPGSEAAQWAQVTVADRHLAEGCDELFQSRAGANQELEKAREGYEAVLEKASMAAIRQRAQFGLARVLESQGQLDKAIALYQKVVEAEGAFSDVAELRVAALSRPDMRKFYDKFAAFDPKPSYREGPVGPLNLDNLDLPGPGEPLLPGGGDLGTPAAPSGAAGEDAGETGPTSPTTTPAAGDVAPAASPAPEPAASPAESPAESPADSPAEASHGDPAKK